MYLAHYNQNHDPKSGRFASGHGGHSRPNPVRWLNSTEEDGLDRYRKNLQSKSRAAQGKKGPRYGLVGITKLGVTESLRGAKKGYQALARQGAKMAAKVDASKIKLNK